MSAELTQRALDLISPFPEARKLQKKLQVIWNARMRSAAGRAFWPEAKVELNPQLRGISEEEVERTLRHELAHILVFARYGTRRKPHGAEWRLFCTQLGIPDETATHSLALPARRQERKYRYVCNCCGKALERVRPLRREAACVACCRRFSNGRFDQRFTLKLTRDVEKS